MHLPLVRHAIRRQPNILAINPGMGFFPAVCETYPTHVKYKLLRKQVSLVTAVIIAFVIFQKVKVFDQHV